VVASVSGVRDPQKNHSDSGTVGDGLGHCDDDDGYDGHNDYGDYINSNEYCENGTDDGIDSCNSHDRRSSDDDFDDDVIHGNCDN
jgi:hypothetical protein